MIHDLACVSEDSVVGEATKVYQYANICRGATVGNNVSVGPYTNIDMAKVGDNTVISMWSSIPPGWEVKSMVFVGPAVILVNDTWPEASKTGFDVNEIKEKFDQGKRIGVIENGAVIGAQCTIMGGVRIGKGALVAAGSVVTQDVPDGMMHTRGGEIIDRPKLTNYKRVRWLDD